MMTLQGGVHGALMFESGPREPLLRGACKGSLGSEAGQRDRWLKRRCLMALHPTSPAFLEGQPWLRHLRPVGCPTPCLLSHSFSSLCTQLGPGLVLKGGRCSHTYVHQSSPCSAKSPLPSCPSPPLPGERGTASFVCPYQTSL